MTALVLTTAHGGVVINEIMYHAPDDLDDLEYIELRNTSSQPVDLSNWSFTKGIKLQFPAATMIEGNGFLVLARNADRFREYYQREAAGTFAQKLSNDGEKLELSDASGKAVDSVAYKDRAPWPLGADGHSGSLERIDPNAPGGPENWVSSPLAPGRLRPGGSPGQPNSGAQASLPPVIENVTFTPRDPAPSDAVRVEADVRDVDGVAKVELLFRLAGAGFQREEASVDMQAASGSRFAARIPPQSKDQLVRFRIRATDRIGAVRFYPAESEPRPAMSVYVHEPIQAARIPFAWIIHTEPEDMRAQQRGPAPKWGPRGRTRAGAQAVPPHSAAFVYFDPATQRTEVFDFTQVTPRGGGRKVRLYTDQSLDQMTTLNLIFEYDERFVLTEPLAYELYRRAGMAAEKSYHVRLWVNGQPHGYQLLVEQPNRAFLRRNNLRDDGNLYKMLWYEQGLVGQHEKKTNTREGHEDLKALHQALVSTSGREQWEEIKKHFDVPQVAAYFAVNHALSHWDGFFNNYFTYHDAHGTGKWMMFPWDQDKTWGIVDGRNGPFFDMPITFGANGDNPPGRGNNRYGGFHQWWRPPGWFSGPLLANPYFRRICMAKTKQILQEVYTPEKFEPLIADLGERLREEVKIRAELMGENPSSAQHRLERNLNDLREHLRQRREFLLAQAEIENVVASGGE